MKISVGKQAVYLNISCAGGLFTAAGPGRLIILSQLGFQPLCQAPACLDTTAALIGAFSAAQVGWII